MRRFAVHILFVEIMDLILCYSHRPPALLVKVLALGLARSLSKHKNDVGKERKKEREGKRRRSERGRLDLFILGYDVYSNIFPLLFFGGVWGAVWSVGGND